MINGKVVLVKHGYSDEEDLNEYELSREIRDPKQRWINRIIRSMKDYYKKCPYYDARSNECFIMFNAEENKCPREGKYEGCPILEEFLAKRYEELKKSGRPIPYDFRDITLY